MDNLTTSGEQTNVLVFFGQRRVGKSSLLYHLTDTPLRERFVFAFIDCQGFSDLDMGKVLYSIAERIWTGMIESNFQFVKPDLATFERDTSLALDHYLDAVEEVIGPRKVLLMFDEYEYLEYKVQDGSLSLQIFNKLRNLMQHRDRTLAFIFVGTHRLTELNEDYWSFLFNIALYHEIGPLSREEGRRLVCEPVDGYLRYDDLAVEKILRVTGSHPYFIQVTCRLVINYCNKEKRSYVTLADINEILKEAVEGSAAHVQYLFRKYANSLEQEVLALLSGVLDESKLSAGVHEILKAAEENGVQIGRKEVLSVLSTLKSKRLIREEGQKRGELFSFEIELLRIWIKEHVVLQKGILSVG